MFQYRKAAQMVGKALEARQEINRLDDDAVRHPDDDRGEVEYGRYSRFHYFIRNGLGCSRRHRDECHVDVAVMHHLSQVSAVRDGDARELFADAARVAVRSEERRVGKWG